MSRRRPAGCLYFAKPRGCPWWSRLLSTVPEAHLREDQSDLANWTRGDRKARFEQTAERHAGLSRFAGPFLSR